MFSWNPRAASALLIASMLLSSTANGETIKREPLTFAKLPGWDQDDHIAALRAFRQSCAIPAVDGPADVISALNKICAEALALSSSETADREKARLFFETKFRPFRLQGDEPDGLLTGYFEPELEGSLLPTKRFCVPVLRRPDLFPITHAPRSRPELCRGAVSNSFISTVSLMPTSCMFRVRVASASARVG